MDSICYSEGSCSICGCQTTHLQCAAKACDKPCYPDMMDAGQWKHFKSGAYHFDRWGEWQMIVTDNPRGQVSALAFVDARGPFRKRVSYKETR
jgi:hypothetical protein